MASRQSETRIVWASTDSCVFCRRYPRADDSFPAEVREYLAAQGQDPERVLAVKATPPRASFSGHMRLACKARGAAGCYAVRVEAPQ